MKKNGGIFFFICTILILCLFLCSCLQHVASISANAAEREIRPIRILFMGRDRSAGLADSMMIVCIADRGARINILQIPRDTYGEYTERDYKKLNGLLNQRGEKGSVDFLSHALGIRIDYFAVLNLDALRRLVDAVGGVDLEIQQSMDYSDPAGGLEIHLKPGKCHLDGNGAEEFIRFRSGYPDGDLGRLDAQKQFVDGFISQIRTAGLADRSKLALSLLPSLSTDVDLPTAMSLLSLMGEGSEASVTMETLCGSAAWGNSGASYYVLNREGVMEQLNRLMLPDPPIDQQIFDPNGVFDREDHKDFHYIYSVPPEERYGA